jgi:hypothetical protein
MNFRKISAIASSILLTSMSVGVAAAANYPAPFVSGSSANVAVVYGTGVGVSSVDQAQANKIETNLLSGVTSGGVTTVSGGESFTLDKSSDHFNFNDELDSISGYSDLGKDELDFLADGTYDDGAIDEDYTQLIDLSSQPLTLFASSKYMDSEPTVGFWFDNKDNVLSYTIEFDNAIALDEIVSTNMPLLGAEYYVLDAEAGKITLLDSADTTILAEGSEVTVEGKTVSVTYIDGEQVKLVVDGESTDLLEATDTYKLDDGSYLAIVEVLSSSRETTTQKVEFSIGSGKIILDDGSDIIFGEDSTDEIDELTATIDDDGTDLTSITINWASKDDTFLAEGGVITMPGFGVIALEFGGLDYASSSETISVENGDTLTLVMENYEIPLMWMNESGYQGLGEEDSPLILVNDSYTYADAGYANASVMFWEAGEKVNTTVLATGLAVQEDDVILVTRVDQDLSDVETLYYEVADLEVDGDQITLELTDIIGSDDLSFEDVADTDEHGDVVVTLAGFDSTNTTAYLEFAAGSDTITYNVAVSDKGMVIVLPSVAEENQNITFTEANEDGDLNEGVTIRATVENSSNDKLYVALASDNVLTEETTADNEYIAIVDSLLASKIMTNEPTGSDNEYDLEIEYFGEEVTATVNVVAGGDVSTSAGSVGNLVVRDSEVSDMSGKNLIIVGGSCINSAAATALGVSEGTCGAAFTAATGVGTGQFLIQAVEDVFSDGKIALVVAGWETDDTTAAVDYLISQKPSTSVGKKVLTTSSTEAVLA